MKVLVFQTTEEANDRAAKALADEVAQNPAAVLGLATGGTMEGVYAALIPKLRARMLDLSRLTTFNLDEYWGLAAEHPASYRSYMQARLFDPLGLAHEQTHLPRGDAPDPDAEARRYERSILRAGGLDLQLLGIGRNGHIGFNEPTSSLASRTRIKTLTQSTRDANRAYFDATEEVPKYALTMGIGTILDARKCVLVATGTAKASAVRDMIEGPLGAHCPATALQLHPRATIVLDADAASLLQLREYYDYVHPNGEEVPLAHG